MPARTLVGIGAIGETVRRVQEALIGHGCAQAGADGVFGKNTATAIRSFQKESSLALTGTVDSATWQALMHCAVPSVGNRSLQLTAAFEGHGFELAVGNFDGALLTWGIIGFTLKSGTVQTIVDEMSKAHPELVKQVFGEHTPELIELIKAPPAKQKQWADEHTVKSSALAEPWRSLFATFGSLPEVQQAQLDLVNKGYLAPAIATAKQLGFRSELGLALCFDAQVQNGGVKAAAIKSLLAKAKAGTSERDLRKMLADAVARSAQPAWREDVRQRKLTIATGQGIVHGHKFVLDRWGLSAKFSAAELSHQPSKNSTESQVVARQN
jgi:Putative peptidoglycan binding domain/Glycosyl hydrolase family 46